MTLKSENKRKNELKNIYYTNNEYKLYDIFFQILLPLKIILFYVIKSMAFYPLYQKKKEVLLVSV